MRLEYGGKKSCYKARRWIVLFVSDSLQRGVFKPREHLTVPEAHVFIHCLWVIGI